MFNPHRQFAHPDPSSVIYRRSNRRGNPGKADLTYTSGTEFVDDLVWIVDESHIDR